VKAQEQAVMKTNKTAAFGLWAACLAAGLLTAAPAHADGFLVKPQQVAQPHRGVLAARIQSARQQHPDRFRALHAVTARAARLDAGKRGRLAPISPMLRALGPEALLPMLELIAFEAPARGTLRDTAWRALRAGLLEAVGALRDPSARPVLQAVLDSSETDEVVLRTTTSTLGRLGEDQDVSRLISLTRAPGSKRLAVLAGMGDCRRAAAVEFVSRQLAAERGEGAALAMVRSLGRMGSAWAWKTPELAAHSAEEASVRAAAARALVEAFAAWEGRVRAAASDSLMLVDDPATPSLISARRASAQGELAAEFDQLSERFARNPTR
jgi:hypothetical protein